LAHPFHTGRDDTRALVFLLGLCTLLAGCELTRANEASIIFTKLPPAAEGSPDKINDIQGRVNGAHAGQRIVIFARSGLWWVQPMADQPFTAISRDSTWKSATHPGSAYAALLVNPGYRPPTTANALPEKGGDVVAVATAEGPMLTRPVPKTLHFSGYDWDIRDSSSDRGGTRNLNDPANAWTDEHGLLHLRIAGQPGNWTSGEVSLTRSLGYGTYRFIVRDVSHLEPAIVFGIFTWDDSGPSREMDIEVSRWGEAESKNSQYVIQPYYVPANVVRFMAPAGVLTHWIRWEPGRATFKTMRGPSSTIESPALASHVFTSGVPAPGNEVVRMNLYVYDNKTNPLRHGSEVIVEKFEYLP
jgi:hypothetical protein